MSQRERPKPTSWQRLAPTVGRRWTDLVPPSNPPVIVELYALLDKGMVEAWIDERNHVRLLPGRVGVHA